MSVFLLFMQKAQAMVLSVNVRNSQSVFHIVYILKINHEILCAACGEWRQNKWRQKRNILNGMNF